MGIYPALVNLSCGILCFLMAFTFRRNKNAANYIAGYNAISAEERAGYDEKEICRFLSNRLFFYCALMLVTGTIIAFNICIWAMLIGSWSIFSVTFVCSLTYLKHNERFRKSAP